MAKKRTVVIAIDESEHSEFAFDYKIHREDDRVVLVHVPEYNNILSASSFLTDPNIVTELLKDNEERISDLIDKYTTKMKEVHVSIQDGKMSGHVKQQCGKPGEAIIETTREEGAAMLVLGTRGMGLLRRTFTGSVSDYCLHHSDIPVLICSHKHKTH